MLAPSLSHRGPSEPLARLPLLPTWPRWARWALLAALWTLPGLAALSYYYLNLVVTAQPAAWTYALVSTLPWWYTWALLTPGIIALARRFPITRTTWWWTLLGVHLPAMLVLLGVHAAVSLLLFRTTGIHDTMTAALLEVHFTSRMHVNALAYFTVLAVYHAYDYARLYQHRERQAAHLELQLAQARLRALKMQLNPHFLFNTLHSVAALIRKEENATAIKMLGRLGEFLRLAIENQGAQEIPLAQEVDFLTRYLEIEKVRFQDRLTVVTEIDGGVRDCYVPNLLLQPLVENAIHHGIAPKPEAGRLEIRAWSAGDRLVLLVRDDGAGLPAASAPRWGVGLSNTAQRLEQLYGNDQSLELRTAEGGGLEVQIMLPLRAVPVTTPLPEDEA